MAKKKFINIYLEPAQLLVFLVVQNSYLFNVNKSIVQFQKIITHSAVLGCVLKSQCDNFLLYQIVLQIYRQSPVHHCMYHHDTFT